MGLPKDKLVESRPQESAPSLPYVDRFANQDALHVAYEQHVQLIYQFIYSRIGNREDAEDLTSQVFVRAVPALETNRSAISIRSWLYQVARTSIADYWREHYKAPTVPLDFVAHAHQTTSHDKSDEEGIAEPKPVELRSDMILKDDHIEPANKLVEQILTALPANYQQILKLRFLRGYSIKEAAAEMGISENNAKVIQYRALQKAAEMKYL